MSNGNGPVGRHDAERLAHVRPDGWRNPTPQERYHVVVIGAGTAGLVTAAAAAGLGAKVALIERHLMGGDCLNVGCVPSKAVLRAAHAWHAAASAAGRFGGPGVAGPGDFAAALERMRELRARIAPVDGAPRFAKLGIDVFFGSGRFTDARTIDVAGARLRFRRAVIATGARPALPPIDGLVEAEPLTNETVFDLTARPERLVVLGAGPIGCELAQAFARFGSRVTLLEAAPHILPREDADAAAVIDRALRADGVDVRTGIRVLRVDRNGGRRSVRLEQDGVEHALDADHVLVAAGRTPNIESLGLDAAGIRTDAAGVVVDDRLRTANPRVYAVGDVCSKFQFTHVADWHARAVVQNALFFGRARTSRFVIPWVTYTSPELAHVGMNAAEARRRGDAVRTLTLPLEHVDRAILDGATDGFLRIHVDRGGRRILGATLVAERAGDMIGEVTLAMTHGLGIGALGSTIHPYPTIAEVFRKAADQHRRTRLTPLAMRIFDAWFRLFR